MDRFYKNILCAFRQPMPEFQVWQIKVVIALILVYKLLSRDFSNFALWPASVLLGYPVDIYTPDYIQITGIPPLFDLVTFHFIHYLVPLPTEFAFNLLQYSLIFLAIVLAITPLRHTRLIACITYILCVYLWGFVYRGGQEIDAMFLIQGALLILAIVPKKETYSYSGYIYSGVLLVFIIYYFFSGLNKLIDLDLIQFFQYELTNINTSKHLASTLEGYHYVPMLKVSTELGWLISIFGAALTYAIHITAPLLFFNRTRSKLLFYWFFYSLFHFLTAFVGILFTANMLAWLMLFPIRNNERE